jgi:hypothetical protein
MIKEIPRDLYNKGFITPEQFSTIDAIVSGKVVSVFYELRTLLYLGIMLFTTGVGILIYKNIGDIGHIISISLLMLLDAFCVWYIFQKGPSYSNEEVKRPTPYFDYIVLLTALLLISVIAYFQFLYDVFDELPQVFTLITSVCFFFIAYRFDHKGVLSLAITSLASFFSISVSLQSWHTGNFFEIENLYLTAIIFGTSLCGVALFFDRKKIKTHFTFSYLNFGTLIFFIASVTGLFSDEWYGIYLILIYAGCVFAYFVARWKKSFLFLLYAFISAYIGTTFLLADLVIRDEIEIWFFYSIISCGGFVFFIVKFRNIFKQQS